MLIRITLLCSLAGFASCSSPAQKVAPVEQWAGPECGLGDEVALTTGFEVELTSGPFSIEFADEDAVLPEAEAVPEVKPLQGLRRILEQFREWLLDRPILIARGQPA